MHTFKEIQQIVEKLEVDPEKLTIRDPVFNEIRLTAGFMAFNHVMSRIQAAKNKPIE
jgi:hypothetical protein